MRCCLFQVVDGERGVAGAVPRLGVLRDEDRVIDAHHACVASLSTHMPARRASEIAMSLCPPELVAFLESGRHAWNALGDSLDRLGLHATDPDLETPDGDPVSHHFDDVRIRPVVGWALRAAPAARGHGYRTMEVPVPAGASPFQLHTDGRAYLPEYLVVVGRSAEEVVEDEAWEHVALVTETRPTDPIDAAVLRTAAELGPRDDLLRATVAGAIREASAHAPLEIGDVVRTGLALVANIVDLTVEEGEPIRLDDEAHLTSGG
jgi:hypothetical protein